MFLNISKFAKSNSCNSGFDFCVLRRKLNRILLLVLFFAFYAQAQVVQNNVQISDSISTVHEDSTKLKTGRVIAVSSLATLSFVGSYALVFSDGWWAGEPYDFHVNNDFEYAKNIDKLGHFFSGVLLGEAFYDALRWSGVGEKPAYIYGGILSSISMVGVDVKDAYSEWGFSPVDVLAGVLGGFYPMFKRYVSWSQYVDYKFSYWRNHEAYWEQGVDMGGIFVDDYCNQTHWLSFKVERMLPQVAKPYWPDWLGLAVGVSVQEEVFKKGFGPKKAKREYYAALDFDWEEAIDPQSYAAKRWVRYLNYVKLLAPAVRFSPDVKYYWAYPIKFK